MINWFDMLHCIGFGGQKARQTRFTGFSASGYWAYFLFVGDGSGEFIFSSRVIIRKNFCGEIGNVGHVGCREWLRRRVSFTRVIMQFSI
jgi:hypothetical protein